MVADKAREVAVNKQANGFTLSLPANQRRRSSRSWKDSWPGTLRDGTSRSCTRTRTTSACEREASGCCLPRNRGGCLSSRQDSGQRIQNRRHASAKGRADSAPRNAVRLTVWPGLFQGNAEGPVKRAIRRKPARLQPAQLSLRRLEIWPRAMYFLSAPSRQAQGIPDESTPRVSFN